MKNKERFQLAVDELNAAVFEWNLQEGAFHSSEAYQKYAISQISPEDILHNRGPEDVVYEDDRDILRQFFQETNSGREKSTVTLRLKMTDGSFHWCRMIALFFRDENDNPVRTVGIIMDINEEREQSFMMSSLLNGLPGGVAIFKYGEKLECQYYSDGFAALSGRTREEIDGLLEEGRLIEATVAASDLESFVQELAVCVANGAPINMTYRYYIQNTGIGWLHFMGTKLREEDGVPVYYCVFTKPTEEVALYRNIVENSNSGIFVAERRSRRILFMNEGVGRLFHIPTERVKRRIINADQLPREFELLSHEEVMSLREDEYTEFHRVWQDKLHLCIQAKAVNWNDRDAYILYFSDETVEYEEQLRLQMLIDNVPAGIGIYEVCNGKVREVYRNNVFFAMLGTTREGRSKYSGENAMSAVHPEDRDSIYAHLHRLSVGECDSAVEQSRLRDNKGGWKWINLAASVIERKKDYLKVYVAFSDCDKMMRVQKELQRKSALLDAAMSGSQVKIWSCDVKNEKLLGMSSSGSDPHNEEGTGQALELQRIMSRVHKDSADDLKWLLDHMGDGKRIQKDICYDSEDGSGCIWTRITFIPIFDTAGNILEAVGTFVNITEDKKREHRYEEQLRLSKAVAREALAVCNFNLMKNTVTEASAANQELLHIINESSADAVLRNIRENTLNKEEEDRFAVVRDCKTLLESFERGDTHIEIRHHIKCDNRWIKTSFDMIRNPYTKEVEVMAMLQDIQDAVRAELVVNRLLTVDYEVIMTVDIRTRFVNTFQTQDTDPVTQELCMLMNQPDGVREAYRVFLSKYGVLEYRDRAIQENVPEYVVQVLKESPLYISVFPIQVDGHVLYKRAMYAYLDEEKDTILCALQDVTETYEQEERRTKELAAALEEAEIANKSKTDFLARMSHDMRTPMNGILGLAELSETEENIEILRDNMAKVRTAGKYLLELINDTLDFQKIESGKLVLNSQVVNIDKVFSNIMNMIHPSAKEKNIEITVDQIISCRELCIRIDAVRFTQIIFNLLTNAVKFTPDGGIIMVETKELSRTGLISHIRIRISDSGIGMSEEFVKHGLYTPFSQEHSDISNQYAGTGLGLSIVHSLVTLMGGRIEVESRLGEGTTFTLYLDFEHVPKEEADHIRQKSQSKGVVLSDELRGKKILLAEDHPLNAKIACKMLERTGCKVTWVEDGNKAVDAFTSTPVGTYDVILMDIRMPVMTGLEAARAIRVLEREDAGSIPIIAMTANAYEEDVRKSLDAGMNAHISKPVSSEKLYETVASILKNRE